MLNHEYRELLRHFAHFADSAEPSYKRLQGRYPQPTASENPSAPPPPPAGDANDHIAADALADARTACRKMGVTQREFEAAWQKILRAGLARDIREAGEVVQLILKHRR
jgi:hypothetical protein